MSICTVSFLQSNTEHLCWDIRDRPSRLEINSLILCQFKTSQTLVFRNVAQCDTCRDKNYVQADLRYIQEAAQWVAATYLTFPKASLRVRWLCPISASCWECVTNDSCSLVFFFTAQTLRHLKCKNVPFMLTEKLRSNSFHNMLCVHVSVPPEKYTASPVGCVIIGWQGGWTPSPSAIIPTAFILRPVESPGGLTMKPFPGLAGGHMHVQFSQTYSSNARLPSALLCQLIPKGVWAESNDPLWQPSYTAATPLIFSEMPGRLKGSMEPCRVPFTKY